jgi:hypothetical protein
MLLRGGKHALEADDHHVADDVIADVLWTAAHVFLLERGHSFADFGFDFALRLHPMHRIPDETPKSFSELALLQPLTSSIVH